MTTHEAAGLLTGLDNLCILTHERPDGDTLGSAAALCAGLRALGKTAYILPNPELTPRYADYVAPYHAPAGRPPDDAVLIAVDTAAPERLPPAHRALAPRILLSIDHHPAGARLGLHNCLQADSASTGEIVYEILQALGVTLTAEIALPLYLAVSTDTGCFRYSNTTARTHRVAAALLDTGIDCVNLNRDMFETKSRSRFRAEALMVENMAFFHGDTAAVCCLSQETADQTGVSEDDLDNIAALPRKIQGVEIGIVIKEKPGGLCKISVRASKRFDAGRICALLGGGGHARAAGCTLSLPLPEARQAVLQAVEETMRNDNEGLIDERYPDHQ